jgi:hypothetical protein
VFIEAEEWQRRLVTRNPRGAVAHRGGTATSAVVAQLRHAWQRRVRGEPNGVATWDRGGRMGAVHGARRAWP